MIIGTFKLDEIRTLNLQLNIENSKEQPKTRFVIEGINKNNLDNTKLSIICETNTKERKCRCNNTPFG